MCLDDKDLYTDKPNIDIRRRKEKMSYDPDVSFIPDDDDDGDFDYF